MIVISRNRNFDLTIPNYNFIYFYYKTSKYLKIRCVINYVVDKIITTIFDVAMAGITVNLGCRHTIVDNNYY